MRTLRHQAFAYRERGVTMIEVLVTLIILSFGLLGLAGLQARVQLAEIEAYQRAQAIVLLQDMVDRINANRKNSMLYDGAAVGTGNTAIAANCAGLVGAPLDLCEWHYALLGNAETKGGQSVGAMIGARGCVANTVATKPREFLVSVAWQGVTPTVAPASTTCGQNAYGDEATRRAIVARVIVGCLQNDPTTGLCLP
jgi:type IV pilus assembly protein PilV